MLKKQNRKKKGTIIDKSLDCITIESSIDAQEVRDDFQDAVDSVGLLGKDDSQIEIEIVDRNDSQIKIRCKNAEESRFSDYMSEDEKKRERARCMVKFWAHLAKTGYDIC